MVEGDGAQKEFFAAWTLFIAIMLLIAAFFTSYMLQIKKVTAIHETVISIFAGSCGYARTLHHVAAPWSD